MPSITSSHFHSSVRTRRLLLWALLGAILFSRFLIPSVWIEGGLERAQIYANVCLAIDQDCSYTPDGKVDLGAEQAKNLNVAAHWLSMEPMPPLDVASPPFALLFAQPLYLSLTAWLLPGSIYYPPKP